MVSVFAAIQILEGETLHKTIEVFMRAAAEQKVGFKVLEVLGVVHLGRMKLVRFKTDGRVVPLLQSFSKERTLILLDQGQYWVTTPDGTRNRINTLTMQCVAEPSLRRTYRGVSIQYWDRQFL